MQTGFLPLQHVILTGNEHSLLQGFKLRESKKTV